jgi:mutator family transposase
MAARNSSRSPTGTGSPPSPGRTCSATAPGAGCAPRSWPWATAHSGSGARCGRCSRKPETALLVSQDRQRSWCTAEVRPSRGEESARGDLERRGPPPRTRRRAGVRGRLRSEVPPKATAKITDDLEQLLAFYDYPAEHWIHLRTTNPIESTFATVRHRTKITRGPGSRAAGLTMAFKLIEAAQNRWRAVNAPHLVALV